MPSSTYMQRHPLSQGKAVSSGHDELSVKRGFFKLRAEHERLVHKVVKKPGATTGVADGGSDRALAEDGLGGAGDAELMEQVLLCLCVGKPGK